MKFYLNTCVDCNLQRRTARRWDLGPLGLRSPEL